MPVLFVHGVAVRDEDDPDYATVERLTRGAEWTAVQEALRQHVAPVLNPRHPDSVVLQRVYWGDLGVKRAEVPATPDTPSELAQLAPTELAERTEDRVRELLPPAQWPEAIRATWRVCRDPAVRAQLAARPPRKQQKWLDKQVWDAMVADRPELARGLASIMAEWQAASRRNVRWAMGEVRKPFAGIVPVFVGDVMRYLDGRGSPWAPGEIITRVLDGLDAAAIAAQGGEPLVVLSHSMGGQLMYDALTAFARPDAPRVDLWASCGGQLGMFAELGLFLTPEEPSLVGVPEERLGYLWNAWSSSDVLSFPVEGRIARAHDADFGYAGAGASAHNAYLRDPAFYRTLAALVEVHCARDTR